MLSVEKSVCMFCLRVKRLNISRPLFQINEHGICNNPGRAAEPHQKPRETLRFLYNDYYLIFAADLRSQWKK